MKKHRYIARFIIEAETAFAVGSGDKGISVDRLIARDANNLPYIPGTTLAGLLRSHFVEYCDKQHSNEPNNLSDQIFGFQKDNNNGQGSFLVVSSAHLIGSNGIVYDGLMDLSNDSAFLDRFKKLPNRDHVRMTDKGSADTEQHGKFDEEVVYKGTRFAFEMEFENDGSEQDNAYWESLLDMFFMPSFRIGGGGRKGLGNFNVIDLLTKKYNLKNNQELQEYLDRTSSLNSGSQASGKKTEINDRKGKVKQTFHEKWYHYRLNLQPENFFFFGAGFGNIDVDDFYKTETRIVWENGKPDFIEINPQEGRFGDILIPASSVKGAISHRLAFHYNRLNGITIEDIIAKSANIDSIRTLEFSDDKLIRFKENAEQLRKEIEYLMESEIDALELPELEHKKQLIEEKKAQVINIRQEFAQLDQTDHMHINDAFDKAGLAYQKQYSPDFKQFTDVDNKAVQELFGYSKKGERETETRRGNIILSDVYLSLEQENEHIFNHIAIDRFTGGGIDGALFSEKAITTKEQIVLDFYVSKDVLGYDDNIKNAFEATLNDIVNGNLALGGRTTKGHGVFSGKYELINKAK